MLELAFFSESMGYVSIACWLGAQFPQVLENIRRQSVEGLALPFLANWLLGDLTNLIGCILTSQLPFQKWLATYFCFVDLMLISQYFYYRKNSLSTPSRFIRSRSRTISSIRGGRVSIDTGAPHYRTLSNVAAHAAAAAALAAQAEDARAVSPIRTRWPRHSAEAPLDTVDHQTDRDREDEDEVDEEALAALADSFHSESGRSSRLKRVSWNKGPFASLGRNSRQSTISPLPPHHLQITSPLDELETLSRGRPLQRAEGVSSAEEGDEQRRAEDESQRRRSSRASKRNASIVFMGAWALFGIGTLVGTKRGFLNASDVRVGHVLSDGEVRVPAAMPSVSSVPDIGAAPSFMSSVASLDFENPSSYDYHEYHPPKDHVSWERITGRISAWMCTTLYLTSRLPQIWKNYVRKSVEGLSMYLFIFAFLGNFFYVLSILSSPNMLKSPAEASAYFKESLPYLLGSGGTLMFDVTIVTQSLFYRHRPPLHLRGRRSSVRARNHMEEEEEGLLGAGASGAGDPTTPSRRRLVEGEPSLES
ncbi:hypothetical protein HETIRDRAFT_100579 [Heterobasidion irregulare TC 32-1]|uniref:Uncharacterized protein n=1 Tax=Heterobasidion irregulare (strain TC 32-1) TaxID=747525 RepID=W4KLC2_HETIT|nr:uncharacterized protein HETIRDRAFT_100579 [Heterobasidion irregulare TC 32-1]ETW85836.1 hypothetical protein HETIRDRAFT_100579 [Heterobasidion irregulare TC 32-1]